MQGRPRWMGHRGNSDKTSSTGGGNGKPPQYTCYENLVTWQKDLTSKDEFPRLEGVQYATGEECRTITNGPRKNAVARPKQKRCSVVDEAGDESKT